MVVFSKTYPGRILICSKCGALLGYNETDIYGANLIYCPLCKNCNEIDYAKGYDGIVVEEKKNVQS